MIYKITQKSLKKNSKLLLAMVIMYILANFLLIFSSSVGYHYQQNFHDYMESANVEDFMIQVDPALEFQRRMQGLEPLITDELIQELETNYDVVLEKNRQSSFNFIRNEQNSTLELQALNPNAKMNQVLITEGRLPENGNEIFLNDKYVFANGYSINDEIELFDQQVTIVGYGMIPTYIYPISFQALYPNPERFGSGIITDQTFDDLVLSGQMVPVTTLTGQFNQELSRREQIEHLNGMIELELVESTVLNDNFEPVTKTQSLFSFAMTSEVNPRISAFSNEVSNNAMFLSTMGITISLISVFLTILLFNSILKSQRREMGILKAEGVHSLKIAIAFLTHFIMMLIPAIVLGGILALLATPLLQGMYEQYFSLPISNLGALEMFVAVPQVLTIFVAVVVFVFIFSIYNNLKTPTLLLIKNVDKSQIPKINIGRLLKRAPFILKYRINLLFRNWTKTLFLVFAVMISSFLLLLAALGLSGIKEIFNVFDTMYHYDFEAYHSQVLHTTEDEDRSYLGFILNANIESVTLANEAKALEENEQIKEDIANKEAPTINLFGFYPEQNDLITLTDQTGNKIPYADFDEGIVITQLISELYNLQIGDQVSVSFTNNFNEVVEKTLDVTNIVDNFIYPFAYTHISNTQNLSGAAATSFNVQVGMMENRNAVFERDPNVMFVSTKEMLSQLEQQTDFIYVTMGIVAVVAGIISFVTLTSISSVIVNSNRKTISIMKVMGYHNSEIKKMTIASYKWICIFVYFATIPFILWLINTLVGIALKNQDFTLPLRLNLEYLILGFIVIFGVYLISSSIVFTNIKKINMSESLKADE